MIRKRLQPLSSISNGSKIKTKTQKLQRTSIETALTQPQHLFYTRSLCSRVKRFGPIKFHHAMYPIMKAKIREK